MQLTNLTLLKTVKTLLFAEIIAFEFNKALRKLLKKVILKFEMLTIKYVQLLGNH